MVVYPSLARLRQKDHELEVRLGYIVSSRSDWTTKQNYELKKVTEHRSLCAQLNILMFLDTVSLLPHLEKR